MSVADAISKLSFTHPAVDTVLGAFTTGACGCVKNFELAGEKVEVKVKKAAIKKMMLQKIEQAAAKYLLEGLKLKMLQTVLAPLEIDHKAKGNNPNSKRVLYKRLQEALQDNGIEKYMTEYGTVEMLTQLIQNLKVHPKSSNKKELVKQLVNELHFAGMNIYFESFPLAILHDICFEMELEDDPKGITNKKALLIQAIINQEAVKVPKRETNPVQISKKKKAIKKGISVWDIVGHYSSEELNKWCKDNKIKSSGTKKEMARRIVAFLDNDKENIVAKPRTSKKKTQTNKPKRNVSRKKAQDEEEKNEEQKEGEEIVEEEQAKDVNNEAQQEEEVEDDAGEEEGEEEEEEEDDVGDEVDEEKKQEEQSKMEEDDGEDQADDEEAEGEEDDDNVADNDDDDENVENEEQKGDDDQSMQQEEAAEDEELDLDNLEQYDMKVLKEYCQNERLVVKGKKQKKDFIEAILAYNAQSDEDEVEV